MRGVLGNALVCLAVWLAIGARSVALVSPMSRNQPKKERWRSAAILKRRRSVAGTASISVEDTVNQRRWLVAHRALFVVFLVTAALNMLHVRGGFLTNHAADLVAPAWLYVVFRGLYSVRGRHTLLQRTLGRTPERAALSLFIASTLTEITQFYWPRGIFPGRFDAWDIFAYAFGLAACYWADKHAR